MASTQSAIVIVFTKMCDVFLYHISLLVEERPTHAADDKLRKVWRTARSRAKRVC